MKFLKRRRTGARAGVPAPGAPQGAPDVAGDAEVSQSFAQELLAGAVRIDVGGVEEVHPKVEGVLDHLGGLLLVEGPQEEVLGGLPVRHAADADAADFNASVS